MNDNLIRDVTDVDRVAAGRPAYVAPSALRVSRTYLTVVFVTVLVFLSEWIQSIGPVSIPAGARDITVLGLFGINWLLSRGKLMAGRGYRIGVVLLGAYLLAEYLFGSVPTLNFALGTAFTCLFIGVFLLGSSTRTSSRVVIKIFNGLVVFFFVMTIGPVIQGVIAGTTLRLHPGIFRELGAFGTAMNIGTTICLSLYIMTRKTIYIYIAGFFTFGILLTILKKSILECLVIWIAFVVLHATGYRRVKVILFGIVVFAFGFSLVRTQLMANVAENIDYFDKVGVEEHVRTGMFIASYRIASDYFPFGSGMGTFASIASVVGGYSHVYFDYGVSTIGYNSPADVAAGYSTLFDTFWPHILGELGFLGALSFLYLWLYPAKLSYSVMRTCRDPIIKGFCFYVVLMGVMMTIEGFVLFTPEIPSFIILHSGLTGMAYYHVANYRRSNELPSQRSRKRVSPAFGMNWGVSWRAS